MGELITNEEYIYTITSQTDFDPALLDKDVRTVACRAETAVPDYKTVVKHGQKKKVGKGKRNMFTCKINLAYLDNYATTAGASKICDVLLYKLIDIFTIFAN